MNRLVYIIIFLITGTIFCNAATIRGKAVDTNTGEVLTGCTIYIKELNKGTITGLDGTYIIKNVPVGNYTITASLISYSPIGQSVSVKSESDDKKIDFSFEPLSTRLNEVTVTSTRDKSSDLSARASERNSNQVINVVSARSIELSPDITVANVIQRVSGVTVERNSNGDGQYAILRGMDKRYNNTLVNGVKIPGPDNKNRFVPLDIFPAELLDRLEVTKALTANMEGDATGGAVNMVMKDAPEILQITANLSTGYNALFFDRDFNYLGTTSIDKSSPLEIYGEDYPAKPRDFSSSLLKMKSGMPSPNIYAGFSFGDRLIKKRLGLMLAGSYQNSYRGSNSSYFETETAMSDASNLPVLTGKNNRTYSDRQTRYGIHAKLDFRLSPYSKIQWYNAYMDFTNMQIRDNSKTDLSIGYNPGVGDYNVSFDTRFRMNHQQIINSTLKGEHNLTDALKIDWSGVYSKAFNETPDNTTVYTHSTVRNYIQNPVSVVTLGGANRRWEHNTDRDWAGYLNLSYIGDGNLNTEFSAGGMYRDKQRTNFFNQYDFRPYDESKPEGMRNNLIEGVDWNDYSEIKFMVYTPLGSIGNPLNYDASEKIGAGYVQAKSTINDLQITMGLRAENTNQGYDLKYAIDGVGNKGSQIYTDLLPDVHVKYSPFQNTNIRASYFKSVNRPSFFEIVPYRILNEEYTEMGNPDLSHTIIHNIDVRYEYFPKSSEQFMVGLFYKKLKDPIEYGMITQGQATFYTPSNFGDAANYGLEIDVTKYFYSFGIKANYTFTQSAITTNKLINYENPDPASSERILLKSVDQTRPLYGQAKHVANLSLLYKDVVHGWDGQLALSYTSDRLYVVSRFLDNDIWQAGYLQLDASLEKKLKYGLSLFAKASNLLDTPMILYLKKQNPANMNVAGYENYKNGTLVRRDYYGQNLQIGVKYKF